MIDRKELELLFQILDSSELSPAARETVHSWLLAPPDLEASLELLRDSAPELRHGLMIAMVELAIADGRVSPEEEEALTVAQQRLGVSTAQREAIQNFAIVAKQTAARGKDDPIAAQAMKNASAGLTAVGIPLTALYFSGSVVGLSAAGVTSGLAALGLGFGMVPGIGVVVVLGVATFYGVRKLLGRRQQTKAAEAANASERAAQLVIRRLQEAVTSLQRQIAELELRAADAETTREALQTLLQRIKQLQESIQARQSSAA